MSNNSLGFINFSKIYDMYGEDAAINALIDVKEGRICVSTLEKSLYKDETKNEYIIKLKNNMRGFKYD